MTRTQIIDLRIPLRDIPPAVGNPDLHLQHWLAPRDTTPVPYRILRKSVDARKRSHIVINYRVEIFPSPQTCGIPDYPVAPTTLRHPLIVGAGPAGLFAAWVLARAGAQPIILERGRPVGERCKDIADFISERKLNTESNYLFGEGGAGTYSDGKLYTRIKDPRCKFILEMFTACGAPKEILWEQRPHIGSDRLPGTIAKMREEIIACGGQFLWGKRCESLLCKGGNISGVRLADGEILETPAALLAIGHSARDLIRSMTRSGVGHTLKSFQVGSRVEHRQALVDRWQYGSAAGSIALPVPEYHIVSRPPQQHLLSAVSFCMCPGGEIIPAAHREGELCTNGMSPYQRDLPYANAAIIVALENKFATADAVFDYIEMLERKSFDAGGGNWTAPAQDVVSFVREERGLSKPDKTSYRLGLTSARLDQLLPKQAKQSLQAAYRHFENMMPGFATEGKLVGLETRVSSPVRFERDAEKSHSVTHENLYIAGEGAGHAGGIISAAVDGMKLAEAMLANWKK